MTQRDHAGEAQLEPGPDGVGRRCDKHGDRRKRKHGVTVHVLACPWAPVIDALKERGNNKSQTAKTLGITREGLHKKLKGFGSG